MTDHLPQTDRDETDEELDTEGHAASWKTDVDPRTGQRRMRQAWTADEPANPGTHGRVTTPRPSQPR